ncbi:hypothetical protein LEP1GSC065_0888 [Leptospira kirschneri serovar Sokoine str. RM1]|nr:hypothetical protein LEP1GSC166_3206 [Leptospira kirschneri]EMN27356.1 hypothetical protein LEP1GSC065_0888 [Leptospira kirschneri serovar Sokoine str. RM1]EMO82676.1 hypothetical protein LEP1GSC126_0116 [Leptospira kirschneri str. 200801774]
MKQFYESSLWNFSTTLLYRLISKMWELLQNFIWKSMI